MHIPHLGKILLVGVAASGIIGLAQNQMAAAPAKAEATISPSPTTSPEVPSPIGAAVRVPNRSGTNVPHLINWGAVWGKLNSDTRATEIGQYALISAFEALARTSAENILSNLPKSPGQR